MSYCVFLLPVSAVAVLGIALIAMGEDIGTDMSFRSFGHLVSHVLKFCNHYLCIRNVVKQR